MANDDQKSQITPTELRCFGCNYDISGTPVGGICPECGKSVYESIRAVQIVVTRNDTASNCMILGIISIVTCGFFSPFAIWLYYNTKKEFKTRDATPAEHRQASIGLLMAILSIFMLPLLIIGAV